uniref:Sphingomyelin phosphodiesterase D LrSicTox-alphaIB1 n=1 Tax=Parasteatoda tepidariorum TaxID=114398 RepID=A0A2L2YJU4_PARTP
MINHIHLRYTHVLTFILLHALLVSTAHADKRPFYVIAHMVNELRQVRHYLDRGANSLESDIQFYSDGSVKEVYHGFPCDCFRTCTKTAGLSEYLQHVRKITDPNEPNNYYDKMVLQMLDLKMSSSNNKKKSGREIARHILDHLWTPDGSREQEVKVLIYIESIDNKEVIYGVLEEFQERGQEARLKDVGFDGGQDDIFAIRKMFVDEFGGKLNVWLGDGKSNCISAFYPDGRLRREVSMRNSVNNDFVGKVYHWTIDLKLRIRLSLNLAVDAILTNDPEDVIEVLQESYYKNDFRLATPYDDPFSTFRN